MNDLRLVKEKPPAPVYAKLCMRCREDCKQEGYATILECKYFVAKPKGAKS